MTDNITTPLSHEKRLRYIGIRNYFAHYSIEIIGPSYVLLDVMTKKVTTFPQHKSVCGHHMPSSPTLLWVILVIRIKPLDYTQNWKHPPLITCFSTKNPHLLLQILKSVASFHLL